MIIKNKLASKSGLIDVDIQECLKIITDVVNEISTMFSKLKVTLLIFNI